MGLGFEGYLGRDRDKVRVTSESGSYGARV